MATKGLYSRDYVNKHYHLEWSFQYTLNPGGGDVQHLKKIDLDCLGDRDQIKIWGHCVRAFIQQKTDVVSVHMFLPQKVDRIIIFRFGEKEPVCFAENDADGVQVFPGTFQRRLNFCWNWYKTSNGSLSTEICRNKLWQYADNVNVNKYLVWFNSKHLTFQLVMLIFYMYDLLRMNVRLSSFIWFSFRHWTGQKPLYIRRGRTLNEAFQKTKKVFILNTRGWTEKKTKVYNSKKLLQFIASILISSGCPRTF